MISETKFRVGACHGAQWLRSEVKRLATEGRSPDDISSHLGDLMQVMLDWRTPSGDIPDGNPWEWSNPDLEAYIESHREIWNA